MSIEVGSLPTTGLETGSPIELTGQGCYGRPAVYVQDEQPTRLHGLLYQLALEPERIICAIHPLCVPCPTTIHT
jgi:hypothetical protein